MLIQNKTFCIKNLGCRTNICETNVIFDQLIKNKAINVKNFNDANICIINSCCVTNKAEQKTYLFINQAIRSSKCELIAVIGCLPQIGKLKLVHHKIGIVIGNKHKTSLISYIKKYQSKQIYNVEKFNKSDEFEKFGNFHHGSTTRAFIKIQEGCNFMCSYCIIPFARGRQHSLSHVNVLKLINLFVKNGFQEIVLVGVNTAGYKEGTKYFFIDLLKDINKMPGNFRIRISSLEPFQMNKAIVDLITSNHQRWCQHFHICLQSGADITIKNMQRKYTIQKFFKLCKYIRFKNPLASITTDCIVGFPTETSKDFNESYWNIKKINFADIHIFPYSSRPFTAASKLKSIVKDIDKKQRFIKLDKLKNDMKIQYLKKFINKKVHVLFEKSTDNNLQTGHSEYFFKLNVMTSKNLANKLLIVKIKKIIYDKVFGELSK